MTSRTTKQSRDHKTKANNTSETWKRQRKYSHHVLSRAHAASQHSYPTTERNRLLYKLLQEPAKYEFYLEEYTGRTISRLAWGSADHQPKLKKNAFGLLTTISPSGAVPNVVSWLAILPTWLSPWKQAEKARHEEEAVFFRDALRAVEAASLVGEVNPSYSKTFWEGREKHGWEEEEWTHVVGMMAIAGALTMASPLQTYILAMCHHPDWQAKMQDQIREVCGDRCPEWDDRDKLHVVRAVIKEVLRWRPPVPTGKFGVDTY